VDVPGYAGNKGIEAERIHLCERTIEIEQHGESL
jgi:hypothetical protein